MTSDGEEIREIARHARRIAVLGIKTEERAEQPAFYVAKYLVDAGIDVVPVPVYYPRVTRILGREVVRRVVDAGKPIDIVDVFRRAEDLASHVDDLIAARPACVWFQLGIRNDEVAATLERQGIVVVQDRCLMVEHRAALHR